MFSDEYKQKIMKKYNITESQINSSIHYKIPDFVFQTKFNQNNQCRFHHPEDTIFKFEVKNNPDLVLDKKSFPKIKTSTQYEIKKKQQIYNTLNKIQREKIDLLINRAYEQINDEIRNYNNNVKNRKRLKILPLVTKEQITEHILNEVNKYLTYSYDNKDKIVYLDNKKKLENNKSNLINNKQYIWSHDFMEQKKNNEYKKLYSIKYIDTTRVDKNIILSRNKKKIFSDIPSVIKIEKITDFKNKTSVSIGKNKKKEALKNKNLTSYGDNMININNYEKK